MIILEGADSTGKTTLARALAQALEVPVRHMSRPDEGFDHVSGYIGQVGRHVQDRFHLGSVVYGQMLGASGGCASPAQMKLVQRYLRWHGCVTVVLHCQRATLARRLQELRKDEMYKDNEILAVNDAYRGLIQTANRGESWCDYAIDVTDRWPDVDDEPIQQLIERWHASWGQ